MEDKIRKTRLKIGKNDVRSKKVDMRFEMGPAPA